MPVAHIITYITHITSEDEYLGIVSDGPSIVEEVVSDNDPSIVEEISSLTA